MSAGKAVLIDIITDWDILSIRIRNVFSLVVHIVEEQVYLLLLWLVERAIILDDALKLVDWKNIHFLMQNILESFARTD